MVNFTAKPLPDVSLTDHIRGILDRLDPSTADVEECIAMPPEVYTSEEWFEFEKRAVWDTEWLCLAHTGLIPKASDYISINVNDDPLLIQRQKDGGVRVMSAVCQHRGHLLGEERGNTEVFTCEFHGWSYDMDGKLISAPELAGVHASLEELQQSYCLPLLRTEVWNGFIFVNMDGQAKPLAPRL